MLRHFVACVGPPDVGCGSIGKDLCVAWFYADRSALLVLRSKVRVFVRQETTTCVSARK